MHIPDWKKEASQVLDSDNVEKAFLDQAYTFVANKVGKLMQHPYILGFEIVQKNDSNTRIVGIFAFRVAKELVYVPVFFLNGEIKGQDLLYRVDSKTFVPSETWAEDLAQRDVQSSGSGMNRRDSRIRRNDMDLRKLHYPPHSKRASFFEKAEDREEFLEKLARQIEVEPVLDKFFYEEGPDALLKVAAAMESNFKLANTIYQLYPDEKLRPEFKPRTIKSASETGGLNVYVGVPAESVKQASDSEEALEGIYKRGYYVEDKRDDSQLSVVVQETEETMEQICGSGKFEVMLRDGGVQAALCAELNEDELCHYFDNNGEHPGISEAPSDYHPEEAEEGLRPTRGRLRKIMAVMEDGTVGKATTNAPGKHITTFSEAIKNDSVKDTPEAGKTYALLNTGTGVYCGIVHVLKKSERDGLHRYTIVKDYRDPVILRHSPDRDDSILKEGFIGRDFKFIEVKASYKGPGESEEDGPVSPCHCLDVEYKTLGDENDLNAWVFGHGYKGATVSHDMGTFRVEVDGIKASPQMDKLSAELYLMQNLGCHAKVAAELVDQAYAKNYTRFNVQLPEKRAAQIQVMDYPEFEQSQDDRFGINMDYPQFFHVDTNYDKEETPGHYIGDGVDPSMGHGPQSGLPAEVVMSAPPEELASMAQSMNLENIFDHGVVGNLLDTYDAISMLDKWIPDLEKALDAMGRMIFLFYWKPGDFQDAYGVDDMEELENQLLANFRSSGELVMNLLKKSRSQKDGPVPIKLSR